MGSSDVRLRSFDAVRMRPGRLGTVVVWVLIFVFSPATVLALTVSPADISGKDINYRSTASLEIGERSYDYNVNFGGSDQSFDKTGKINVLMLRNDFSIADRVGIGLNLGLGDADFGRLNTDSDEISLDGDIGFGGGLRVSAIVFEDLWDAEWFADFQSFALASDPPRTNMQREDWHLAFGARQKGDWINVAGGTLITGSQFDANGTSEGDTFVDASGSQSQRLGLFINTKVPITERIKGHGEVMVTDGITVNVGASYGFTLLDYFPRVARDELEGSRSVPPDQRGLTAEEYLARAQESIANENFENALDWLNQALEVEPRNPETYVRIARSYFLIGEFNRSIRYMRYAVEQRPGKADYHYHMGRFFEASGHREEAVNQYQRAVQLNSSHRKALFRLNEMEGSI